MVNVEDAVCGRIGYAAPENLVTGYLTEKADVCSFSLFLFELLAGRRFGISCCNDEALQPDWVKSSVEQNLLIRIVDDIAGRKNQPETISW